MLSACSRVTKSWMSAPSVLLAEQAIELLIKARLRLEGIGVPKHHRLDELLAAGQGQVASFVTLLGDHDTVEFLNQLESAYSLMRFGEAGYQLSFLPFRDRLDGVAFLCAKPTSTESVLHTLARI